MLIRRLYTGFAPSIGQASSRLQTAWAQPLLAEGAARQSSTFSAQDVEAVHAAPVDEAWWQEVQGGSDGGGGGGSGEQEQQYAGRSRRSDRLDAPIDAPRSLRDYQKMVFALSRRKRCGAPACTTLRQTLPDALQPCTACLHTCRPCMTLRHVASNGAGQGSVHTCACPPCLRCSAYLIRDVVDEMSLNGIRPDKFVLQTGERLRSEGRCSWGPRAGGQGGRGRGAGMWGKRGWIELSGLPTAHWSGMHGQCISSCLE